MFKSDYSPVGLFIKKTPVYHSVGHFFRQWQFYIKPNGVLYITRSNKARICRTEDLTNREQIKFATQSGSMLLIKGQIHPVFRKGSPNVNMRNGVGILPGNRLMFAAFKEPINFHDFASFFRDDDCNNALYLDGFVSKTYLPEKGWQQTDGNPRVFIGSFIPE